MQNEQITNVSSPLTRRRFLKTGGFVVAGFALSGVNNKACAEVNTGSTSLYRLVCIKSPLQKSPNAERLSVAFGVAEYRHLAITNWGDTGTLSSRRLSHRANGYGPYKGKTASDTFEISGSVSMSYVAPLGIIYSGNTAFKDDVVMGIWTEAEQVLTGITIRLDRGG